MVLEILLACIAHDECYRLCGNEKIQVRTGVREVDHKLRVTAPIKDTSP